MCIFLGREHDFSQSLKGSPDPKRLETTGPKQKCHRNFLTSPHQHQSYSLIHITYSKSDESLFLWERIARLLCYPLHTGIRGHPRIDPVDTSHQFSAIISLLPALKDVTVSSLLQMKQNSITTNSHFYFWRMLKNQLVFSTHSLSQHFNSLSS